MRDIFLLKGRVCVYPFYPPPRTPRLTLPTLQSFCVPSAFTAYIYSCFYPVIYSLRCHTISLSLPFPIPSSYPLPTTTPPYPFAPITPSIPQLLSLPYPTPTSTVFVQYHLLSIFNIIGMELAVLNVHHQPVWYKHA